MNAFHIFLIGLKIIFFIQFLLVMVNKNWINNKTYVATEITFKIALSLYIEYILFFGGACRVSLEDHFIIGFGAALLSYDAIFNDLPKLLKLYNLNPPAFLSTHNS
jgi:hypothetical protein